MPNKRARQAIAMPDARPSLNMEQAMKVAAAQKWSCHRCKALLPATWVESPEVKVNSHGSHEAWCTDCAAKDRQSRKRPREPEPTQGGISAAGLRALELQRVTFGKHEGEELGDVPTSYLKWLVCGSSRGGGYNCDWLQSANPRLHHACKQLLAYRLLDVASELD